MSVALQFGRLRAELEKQATPRALIGLAALLLILAFVAASELADRASQLRLSVDDLAREQRLEQALLSDPSWMERSDEIQAALETARERFWRGETPGIVAAQLQGAIESAAEEADLDQVRVNVETTPVPLGTHAHMFEIALTARDRNGQFLAFFQELSRAQGQLAMTDFEWGRSNGALRVRLIAPAILSTTSTERAS